MDQPATSAASEGPDGSVEQISSASDLPVERKRRRKALFPRLCVALFSLILMLAVGVGGLFGLLSHGPVEIAFLSERIENGIEERVGAGIDVSVGRAILQKSEHGLELHVQDVALRDASGRDVLKAPDALVSFNPLKLMVMNFRPDKISLRGIRARAVVTEAGDVVLSTAGASGAAIPVDTGGTQEARLNELAAFLMNAGGGLSAVAIDDATLVVDDRRNGKELVFRRAGVSFDSEASGALRVAGSLDKDGDVIPFSLTLEPSGTDQRLRVSVTNIGDAFIQAFIGAKTPFYSLTSKIEAHVDAVMGPEGQLNSLSLDLAVGAGQITVPALESITYLIDRATFSSTWSVREPSAAQFGFGFAGDGTKITLAGPATREPAGGAFWRWRATGGQWTLKALSPTERQVTVDKADLVLAMDLQRRQLKVESLAITGPTSAISMTGDLYPDGQGFGLNLALAADKMPLRTALRWWPSFASPQARQFLVNTVRQGDLTGFKLSLKMPDTVLNKMMNKQSLPVDAVLLEATVENAVAVFVEGLPPVSGLAGSGTLDALASRGVMTRGVVDLGGGRRIQISEGTFALTGLDTFAADARFRFRSQGSLDSVAVFLKSPAIAAAFNADIDPANVKGQFDGNVSIDFPLLSELKQGDIRTEVNGKMTGVTIDKVLGQDKLENANLQISTDKSGIEIKGEGRWQGLPVTLTGEKDAADGSLVTVLGFTLDDATLKRRGLNLGSQLTGPLPVKIRTLREQGENLRAAVEVDITRAAIDGLLPGFQKPAGRAGKLTFDAIQRPTGFSIQNGALDSGASSFRGQAETQADGTLSSARFSMFRLSPGDNVRLDFDRVGTGAKVSIRGNNFDARPFLRMANQGAPARLDQERDLDLEIKTTLLSGNGGEVLTNADVRIVRRGGHVRQVNATGKLNGQPLSVSGRSAGDGPLTVTLDSDDAGAFLRYMDVYSRMIGGDMNGQISFASQGLSGFMIARAFVLRNEPAIRQLVAENQSPAARALGAETRFTKMRIDFSREGTATTIKDAVIFGNQIGLTFNGVIDQIRDRISLSGTFVPAFGLNNAFAQIPVLGSLLAGSRNEGVLAVTFGVSGKASNPNVTVNPLSAVAPGIFRKIFEFRNETTRNAPQMSPAQQN